MIITTTPSIEGKRIVQYLGVVTGEAVLGANLFRDLFAGIRDIVGGRAGSYEKELRRARELAFEEIADAAEKLGANAVLGVDIDPEKVHRVNKGLPPVEEPLLAETIEQGRARLRAWW